MTTTTPNETERVKAPLPVGVAEWLAFGVILLAYGPLLFVYFQQLWDRAHYQFFPLVLLASGALMFVRWPERQTPGFRAVVFSRAILVGSACLLALAIARLSPFAAYLSFVGAIGAIVVRMGVPAIGPWLLLLLMLRIPYGQDVAAIQAMQRLTSQLSGTALDTMGIEHFVEGNVLVFPSQSLFVEEACSGLVSMLAMVACAGILAVWRRRSLVHGLVLMASGVFWAGAMNVIRVVGIAIALAHFDLDLTEGWRHASLGLFAFAVSLAALVSTDELLQFLLARIPRNPLASYQLYAAENPLVPLWNLGAGTGGNVEPEDIYGDHADDWDSPSDDGPGAVAIPEVAPRAAAPPRPWEWALVPVFVLLGAAQVVAGIGPFSAAPVVRQVALNLTADDLPRDLSGWQQVDFEVRERDSSSAFGEHSRIWTYQNDRFIVQLSLDFVFPEWHALTACYRGAGWTLHTQSPLGNGTAVEAQFTKPGGDRAYLVFNLFDGTGADYARPDGSLFHPQLRRILSGEVNRFTLPSYYQVQLLAGIPGGTLDTAGRGELRRLFDEFEQRMRARFTQ